MNTNLVLMLSNMVFWHCIYAGYYVWRKIPTLAFRAYTGKCSFDNNYLFNLLKELN